MFESGLAPAFRTPVPIGSRGKVLLLDAERYKTPPFSDAIAAIEQSFASIGWSWRCISGYDGNHPLLPNARDHRVAGIITVYHPGRDDRSFITSSDNPALPSVIIDPGGDCMLPTAPKARASLFIVRPDHEFAGFSMARYLHYLGDRGIARRVTFSMLK